MGFRHAAGKLVALEQIRIDGDTQSREEIDEETVERYAEAMNRLQEFPPAVTFFDGVAYWLADGFHRYWASKRISAGSLSCEVREGTREDARFYAAGANADHGLPRNKADLSKAVRMVLDTPKGKEIMARKNKPGGGYAGISKHVGCDEKLVRKVEEKMTRPGKDPDRSGSLTQGRDWLAAALKDFARVPDERLAEVSDEEREELLSVSSRILSVLQS